jgi:hypothetical protein
MLASQLDLQLMQPNLDPAVFGQISAGLASDRTSEQINAAVELRKRMALGQTIERLRQAVTNLRLRYEVAVNPPGTAPSPPDPALATATHEELLAENDSLLDRLKMIYTLTSLRDAQVARFRRWTLYILTALLLILLCTRLPQVIPWFGISKHFAIGTPVDSALNICVLALFGAAGAMVSIMRRSQQALDLGPIDIDPIRQISALRHGFSGMLIAALVGPVLALVLFAVFAGHMLDIAGLTPDFSACPSPGLKPDLAGVTPSKEAHGCTFAFLNSGYNFTTAGDAAKMAIWAFLAGFAERLVPDVLDKFSRAADAAPVGTPAVAPAIPPPPVVGPPAPVAVPPSGAVPVPAPVPEADPAPVNGDLDPAAEELEGDAPEPAAEAPVLEAAPVEPVR